jgi:hypothetical protein
MQGKSVTVGYALRLPPKIPTSFRLLDASVNQFLPRGGIFFVRIMIHALQMNPFATLLMLIQWFDSHIILKLIIPKPYPEFHQKVMSLHENYPELGSRGCRFESLAPTTSQRI